MRDVSCKLLSTTIQEDSIGVQKEVVKENLLMNNQFMAW